MHEVAAEAFHALGPAPVVVPAAVGTVGDSGVASRAGAATELSV